MTQCSNTTFDFVCYDVADMLRDRVFGKRFADSYALEGMIEKRVEKSVQSEVYTRLTSRNAFSWNNIVRQLRKDLYSKQL